MTEDLYDSPDSDLDDLNEQEEDAPAPDDTPYNEWERWPWRWPGNNGPMVL